MAVSIASEATVSTKSVVTKKKAKKFKNCTALNKVYKHGVGKPGAKDKSRGKCRVTTFKKSAALYKANKKMDRDKDGIACMKR